MTNLARFDNDEIEIFVNKDTGESFASLRGLARMADEHQETIRRFIGVTNTQTTTLEILTPGGLQGVTIFDEDAILVVLEKYNPSRLKQFAKLGIRLALHQIAGYQISKLSTDTDCISELSGNIELLNLSFYTLSKLVDLSHFRRNPELMRWNNLKLCKALDGVNPVLVEMPEDVISYLWAKFCIETDCYQQSLESEDPFVVNLAKSAIKEHQKIVNKSKYINAAKEFQKKIDLHPFISLSERRSDLLIRSIQTGQRIDPSLLAEANKLLSDCFASLSTQQQLADK